MSEFSETDKKKSAFQIVKFLESAKTEGNGTELDSAIAIISKCFDVDVNSKEDFGSCYYFSSSLPALIEAGAKATDAETYEEMRDSIESNPKWEGYLASVKKTVYFDGVEEDTLPYLERYVKVLQKFKTKLKGGSSKPAAKKSDPQSEKEAEAKKVEGNNAISSQDYNAAVRLYTEAIELCPDGPNTHIYYSNRAAAHCYLTSYELAIEDCEQCIALNSSYVKGYIRLGQAYSGMKDFDNAIEAFKKCVELEPKNKSHKDALSQAKQKKLEHRGQQISGDSSAGHGGSSGAFDMDALKGGMPGGAGGLANMMQNPNVMKAAQDMMGKNGGLEGMMKNPQMMKMAQQMMQNPQLMQQAMSMLGGAGGGGAGGMPDLSALAGMMGGEGGGMPDMSALAGMMGGADGSSGSRPTGEGLFDEDTPSTSSSNGKGKKGKSGSSSSGR